MQLAIAPTDRSSDRTRGRSAPRKTVRSEWPVAVGAFLLLLGTIAGARLVHAGPGPASAATSAQPTPPRDGAD